MKKDIKLSHVDSIMLILEKLSKKNGLSVCYEDIIVEMYKEYPDQFHLKGYPQYPDSEPIGKRLSDAKKRGLVRVSEGKMVSITDLGMYFIESLRNTLKGRPVRSIKKISRISEKELRRIEGLSGFILYCKNEDEKILDTDFYAYLGVSVRTETPIFFSQVKLIKEVIKEISLISLDSRKEIYSKIIDYNHFLFEKFKAHLDFKKNS